MPRPPRCPGTRPGRGDTPPPQVTRCSLGRPVREKTAGRSSTDLATRSTDVTAYQTWPRAVRTSIRSPGRSSPSLASGPTPSSSVSTWPARTVAPTRSDGREPKRYHPAANAVSGSAIRPSRSTPRGLTGIRTPRRGMVMVVGTLPVTGPGGGTAGRNRTAPDAAGGAAALGSSAGRAATGATRSAAPGSAGRGANSHATSTPRRAATMMVAALLP